MPVCSHCGFEYEAGAACPLCGTPYREDTAARAEPSGARPEWEIPEVSFPGNVARTWLGSLLRPSEFFQGVPYDAPALRPVLYFLLITIVSAAFTLWWDAIGVAGSIPLAGARYEELIGDGTSSLVAFWLSPFMGLLGLAIWSLLLHLFVLMLAPRRRGLGATLRVLCYASGPAVFTALPVFGSLVGIIWGVVLQVFGVRAAHRTTTGRAAAIVLLPILVPAVVLLILLAFLVAALGISAFA